MNFATLQGLSIPEGVVTQIADAAGRVIWSAVTNKPVILEVEKMTKTTYVGETSYANESFVSLDIYPKTNGTVNVTYGGLTKTITDTSGAAKPNAQQVFFGTFNGVSDSVSTPTSGTVTIEGAYYAVGCGAFGNQKGGTNYNNCITAVTDFGDATELPIHAFDNCDKITSIAIPEHITSIPDYAFNDCDALVSITLPNSITTIGEYAFYGCAALSLTSLPNGVTSIGNEAFEGCSNITLNSLPSAIKSIGFRAFCQLNGVVLTSFPNGLERIESRAFNGCSNITNITIPATVTYLGAASLNCASDGSGCTTNVKMLGTVPPTMELDTSIYNDFGAFGRGQFYSGTITVLVGYGATYKAAEGWSKYSNDIVEGS